MVHIIDKESATGERHITEGTVTVTNFLKEEYMQVNLFELKQGHYFHLKPPSSHSSIKTYWILEGCIENVHTKEIYHPGRMLVLKSDHDVFHINTLSDAQLLVHSLVDNSFEKAKSGFENISNLLSEIQSKDAYTLDHSERVYQLACKIGLRLGYNGQRFLNFMAAAKYHDVGKIFIPDFILNKPAKLTESEYEQIKTHVLESKQILDQHFDSEVYTIASQHHERLDGSGYPLGLMANEILEEGKIIAICDSYDAMTSARVYKNAKSQQDAIEELKSLTPEKYDPVLLKIFLEVINEHSES